MLSHRNIQSLHCFLPFRNHSSTIHLIYCFFCAAGPISLLKAIYDTSSPDTALRPTYKILSNKSETLTPMKIPMSSQ